MNILQEIDNLIEEAFNSVLGSYNKMVGDLNDLEQNKAQIMKLPLISGPDKVALLQNHVNNTEILKQQIAAKQQEIAKYSNDLVLKYNQQLQPKPENKKPYVSTPGNSQRK